MNERSGAKKAKKNNFEAILGFEPRFQESKSCVLTAALYRLVDEFEEQNRYYNNVSNLN